MAIDSIIIEYSDIPYWTTINNFTVIFQPTKKMSQIV